MLAVAVGGVIGCGIAGGTDAILGYLSGLMAAGLSVLGLAGVVQLLGKDDVPFLGKAIRVSLFIFQFGIFGALALMVQEVGTPAPECFLMGVGLVYMGLVIWAQAKQAEPD
jgi:hypothetical protein